jgi:hypothetical protein
LHDKGKPVVRQGRKAVESGVSREATDSLVAEGDPKKIGDVVLESLL